MPIKLVVLLVIMGVHVALSFANGNNVVAVIGLLVLLGVAAGNEAVRKLVIVLNVLGLGVTVAVGGIGLIMGGVALAPFVLVALAFAIAAPAYGIWCLTRRDVQHWMYKRSMKGAAD